MTIKEQTQSIRNEMRKLHETFQPEIEKLRDKIREVQSECPHTSKTEIDEYDSNTYYMCNECEKCFYPED